MRKPRKSWNFWKIDLFLKENPYTRVPFLAKITLKDGYGFWGSSGTPLSNSNLSIPPGICHAEFKYGNENLNFKIFQQKKVDNFDISSALCLHLADIQVESVNNTFK